MKNATLFLLSLSLVLLYSCSKSNLFQSQGSISGTISGLSGDGQSLNENFDYSDLTTYSAQSSYNRSSSSIYFNIQRAAVSDEQSFIGLTFRKSSNGNIDNATVRIQYNKKLEGSKMLSYIATSNANLSITSFDESSGKIAGTYTASVTKTNTNTGAKNVSTISGKFDVVIYETVE